jgi:hypothetical protein
MNRLFNTHKVVWKNNTYIEIADDLDDINENNDFDEDCVMESV